jgi:hypothetical protein
VCDVVVAVQGWMLSVLMCCAAVQGWTGWCSGEVVVEVSGMHGEKSLLSRKPRGQWKRHRCGCAGDVRSRNVFTSSQAVPLREMVSAKGRTYFALQFADQPHLVFILTSRDVCRWLIPWKLQSLPSRRNRAHIAFLSCIIHRMTYLFLPSPLDSLHLIHVSSLKNTTQKGIEE